MGGGSGLAPRLALLLPPIALFAVVVIAVVGRVSGPGSAPPPVAAPLVAAPLVAAPPLVAATVVVTDAGVEPGAPAATPSPRSDWPAAMRGKAAPTPLRLPREAGTDGLMGRLPFGLPNDTPTIRVEPVEAVNRFVIDDIHARWSGYDTTPPWVRRLGGLSSYVTDPYMR